MKFGTLTLRQVEALIPAARAAGVSSVARSGRGFVAALRRAGSVARLPAEWQARRLAFIARHRAQQVTRGERRWPAGVPTRRDLALAMWAYGPTRTRGAK